MQTPTTLVLGASSNPERYSFLATHLLHEKGYAVYPFGIKKGQIGDIVILNEWPKAGTIDTVTLYVGPQNQDEWVDYIVSTKPVRVIFNPGTINPEFMNRLEKEGVEVLDACTLVMLSANTY